MQELQPKLVKTSIETEQLIEIIEREKEEVAEIKAVVVADEAVANKAATEAKAIKVKLKERYANKSIKNKQQKQAINLINMRTS